MFQPTTTPLSMTVESLFNEPLNLAGFVMLRPSATVEVQLSVYRDYQRAQLFSAITNSEHAKLLKVVATVWPEGSPEAAAAKLTVDADKATADAKAAEQAAIEAAAKAAEQAAIEAAAKAEAEAAAKAAEQAAIEAAAKAEAEAKAKAEQAALDAAAKAAADAAAKAPAAPALGTL